MGRGGGGGGGGGGRSSSGGHSFSGRSSSSSRGYSSSSSSSRGSSSHHSSTRGPTIHNHTNVYRGSPYGGGGYYNQPTRGYTGGYNSYGTRRRSSGMSHVIAFLIVFILIICVVCAAVAVSNSGGGSIGKSTIVREANPRKNVTQTALWYEDTIGDWVYPNDRTLTSGMDYFYQKTGIQPYLIIADNINGKKDYSSKDVNLFMESEYKRIFGDEYHTLMLFIEPYESQWDVYILNGFGADAIIDNEAKEIMYDYVQHYYYSNSMSDAEFFATVYKKSADRIMEVTPSPWPTVVGIFVIGIVIIVGLSVINAVWKNKAAKARAVADAIATPLEKAATEDPILNKYKGEG